MTGYRRKTNRLNVTHNNQQFKKDKNSFEFETFFPPFPLACVKMRFFFLFCYKPNRFFFGEREALKRIQLRTNVDGTYECGAIVVVFNHKIF